MLTLCKTTIYTLLGFSDHSIEHRNPPYHYRNIPSPDADGDTSKPPNIIESSAIGPTGKPLHRTELDAHGLYDLDHGNLCLCIENLGSESCDDGGIGIEKIEGRRQRRMIEDWRCGRGGGGGGRSDGGWR